MDIAGRRCRLPGQLLRREIGQGPDRRLRYGQVARLGQGDAEVGDPGPPVAEQDVRGLEVAMDDALQMEGIDARSDVDEDRDQLVGRERTQVRRR